MSSSVTYNEIRQNFLKMQTCHWRQVTYLMISQILVVNIGLFFAIITFGIMIASSIIVGKYVGRNSIKALKKLTKFIIIYSLIISVLSLSLLEIFRRFIIQKLINQKLIELVKTLLIYYMIFAFFFHQFSTIAGLFKGLRMVKWNAFANFVLMIINLPLCYLLTYQFNYQIYGTRTSYIITAIIIYCLYIFIFWKKVNYNLICKNTRSSLNNDLIILSPKRMNEKSINLKLIV